MVLEDGIYSDCDWVSRHGAECDRGDRKSLLDGRAYGNDRCGSSAALQSSLLGLLTAGRFTPLDFETGETAANDWGEV